MIEQRDLNIIFNNPIDWEVFRNKTVLVTGATGRLGAYIVEAFVKADIDWDLNMNVIALARSRDKLTKVFRNELKLPNLITIVQDITEPIVYEKDVHFIFHTAGAASPKEFTDDPVGTLWGHLMGTRNVLEFARTHNTEKVLYVSTVETYGDWKQDSSIKETDCGVMRADNSRACYPEAKRMCETMFASYEEQYGVNYIGVRLCHTLGPGILLDDGRAFAEFINNALNGKDIVLHSDGSKARTYTYVSDAIGAILVAFTKGKDKYYNVANIDNLISIKDLAELIAKLSSKDIRVIVDVKDNKKLKYLPFKLGIMNVDRICSLGWRPQVGIKETFKYTMDSFEQGNY